MAAAQSTTKGQTVDDQARSIGRISYDTTGQLLSPIEQSRYTSGWTTLAKKYSRPLGKFASVDHRILGNEGKSGLTPREHNPTPGRNKRKRRLERNPEDLEIYQRKRFNGFTNFDLESIQALAALDTNAIHQNLENPIHPCFALKRWVVESQMPKHKGAIPILGREEGFWIYERIWGGQPTSLSTQVYNRGGPGLPNLGIIKTSWFTDKNKSYQTSRKAPRLNQKPKRGQIDHFCTYDYWPVPTSWYANVFTEEFWRNVREFGPEAKKMKIETLGMRFLSDNHPDAKAMIDDGSINIGGGWRYGPPQTRSQTERFRIKNKIASILTNQVPDDKIRENCDSLDYLNARPPIITYSCPRWNEITGYLFDNRGPLKLALDGMEILSEPTFFRYIRDHGGIKLTPMEFRGFLGVANQREELFLWEPFPGFGIVKRIAAGWPPATPRPNSIFLPTPIGEPDEGDMETLDNLMSDQEVQEALYEYSGECRDLDIETFRKWLLYRFDAEEFNGENATEEFRDIIWETVREEGAYFTLGPKDIVRLIYPMGDIREEKADVFTKERMKMLEEKVHGARSGILSL
ncbi:hypothetical protein EYC80_010235 [Monilinia laxa]|uniref:Uncharacterized protein n=1 Tax=Monilinia laxa TaxID=61186 RepID=A0A5N6JPF2_MONLA|nr:hypothetical protein EYC80_010235 [Monilinia laxa]